MEKHFYPKKMNRIFIDTNTKRDEVQSMFTIIFISANVNCSNLVMSGINKDSVKKKLQD